MEQYGAAPGEPLVVCPDGSVLVNPTRTRWRAASAWSTRSSTTSCSTSPWSAPGRPGSSTAVYAASEGLQRRRARLPLATAARPAPARASRTTSASRPASPGEALAGRAYVQAQKFGAEMLIPAEVQSALDCARTQARRASCALRLADGRRLRARTVVIASGARYRRPGGAAARASSKGAASGTGRRRSRRTMCAQTEVALVGGGNSAGQAAVFLSQHAAKVHMLVRGPEPRGEHVALPDRSHRGHAQHRAAARTPRSRALHGDAPARTARRCRGATIAPGSTKQRPLRNRVPVRRRRSGDALARRLQRRGRRARLRAHRRAPSARRRWRTSRRRWSPASPACSRSATCARARSSASAAPSAKAPPPWRRSTDISRRLACIVESGFASGQLTDFHDSGQRRGR